MRRRLRPRKYSYYFKDGGQEPRNVFLIFIWLKTEADYDR